MKHYEGTGRRATDQMCLHENKIANAKANYRSLHAANMQDSSV